MLPNEYKILLLNRTLYVIIKKNRWRECEMEQKKTYVAPELEIIELTVGDIILSSALLPGEWLPGWY